MSTNHDFSLRKKEAFFYLTGFKGNRFIFKKILLNSIAILVIGIKVQSQFIDNEGRFYMTTKIGSQTWLAENLRVSYFRNGDPVSQAKTDAEWYDAGKNKRPAWCYYNNDSANGIKYGKLYNFYALSDPRGLAPAGWHMPADGEWTNLTAYLGGVIDAGTKLKTANGWNGSNITGFTALPGGLRFDYGAFQTIGVQAEFWTSSGYNSSNCMGCAFDRMIWNGSDVRINYTGFTKAGAGFSIRCVRDNIPLSTPETYDIFWGKKLGDLGNLVNDFTGITGDRKYLKINGPVYKILTRYGGMNVEAIPAEKDNGSAWGGVFEGYAGDNWQLIPSDKVGYYYITSVQSGLVLEVDNAATTVAARISLQKLKKDPNTRGNQRVRVIPVSGQNGFYYLQFEHSDLYIRWTNLPENSSQPFIPASTCFIIARQSGKAVDIVNGNKDLGGKVQQYNLVKSTTAQQFIIEPNGDGYYSIKNINSGMCLDVQNGLPNNGQLIWQYLCNKTPAQLFKLNHLGNGFFELESKLQSNLVLTIKDASTANGAILTIATRSGGLNQQFHFLPLNAKIEQGVIINPTLTGNANDAYKFKIEGNGLHTWIN